MTILGVPVRSCHVAQHGGSDGTGWCDYFVTSSPGIERLFGYALSSSLVVSRTNGSRAAKVASGRTKPHKKSVND